MYSAVDTPAALLGGTKRWYDYFTLENVTRTKTTAQVLHEAAEEERESGEEGKSNTLNKVLSVWDVIAYGVGSTIGAGIFAITGKGAHTAGPAIVLSFVVAAISCLFSAFSYMEFAARVPIAGSAYTFTYVCLGELAAWFVGWNLTLEYAISAAVVARTWAANFVLFIAQVGGDPPQWLNDIEVPGGVISSISILSAVICLICMGILLIGVKESSAFNVFITVLNISIILFIICLGAKYVHPDNWTAPQYPGDPYSYFPQGVNGILTGAATVFFSYIGFDAVTCLAEEVKNPKRDVPIGIMATLLISTLLYVGTAIVITGMVPWFNVDPDAPLAKAFESVNVGWAATLIAGVTVTALTGNTLTSLFGQPRVFYRMAKDGLFFKPFGYVHPTTKAPVWGTVYTGVGAALISFFIPLDSLSNMISIGTLMAFSTVCAGVVILRYEPGKSAVVGAAGDNDQQRLLAVTVDRQVNRRKESGLASQYDVASPERSPTQVMHTSDDVVEVRVVGWRAKLMYWIRRCLRSPTFWLAVFVIPSVLTCAFLRQLGSGISIALPIVFGLLCLPPVFAIWYLPVAVQNLPKPGAFTCPFVPFIPCAGIWINIYLITSLDLMSYVRVIVWTAIGFAIYFGYGIFHSTLFQKTQEYEKYLADEKVRPSENGNGNGFHPDDAVPSM